MSAYVERNLWQDTAPESFSAPALAESATADLVIVGGGFTGCAAALAAAEQGMNVRLLEAEHVGHGGSGRNVGLVNAGLWMPPDDIEARLGAADGARLNAILAAAPDLVFSLITEHGIRCNAVHNGTLHCAHSRGGLRELRSRLAQQRARSAPVDLLAAAETRRRTGSKAFHGALFDRRAGTVEPLAYCRGLARAATEAGARLHEGSAARSIREDGSTWHVVTDGGSVSARALLVATNAYHRRTEGMAEPPFTPVHFFQFATAPLAAEHLGTVLPGREGCWDTGKVMSAFRGDAQGRLLVGSIGALDHAGADIHRHWARRKLAALFPQLRDEPFEHVWHGRIAMTRDHLPRIVRLGDSGLMIFGYSGRGIGPGTAFGRAAATALAGGDSTALPLAPQAPPARHGERGLRWRERLFELGSVADHGAWMARNILR